MIRYKLQNLGKILCLPALALLLFPLFIVSDLANAESNEKKYIKRSFDVLIPLNRKDNEGDAKSFKAKSYEMSIPVKNEALNVEQHKEKVPLNTSVENSNEKRVVEDSKPEKLSSGINLNPKDTIIGEKPEFGNSLQWNYSLGIWISMGQTDFNHTSSSPLFGNPTSELIYKDLLGFTGEFQADVNWKSWFGRILVGYGGGDGKLVDDDYVTPFGGRFYNTSIASNHRISSTLSDVELDEMLYAQFDLGKNFYVSENFDLGAYMGYQYWTEENQAEDILQLECTSALFCSVPGSFFDFGRPIITNSLQWHSIRLGMVSKYNVTREIDFNLDVAFIPLGILSNEDTHHFRPDLAQDPSVRNTGNGLGYNIETFIHYKIFPRLILKAGYRYWHLKVVDGDSTFIAPGGFSLAAKLNKFESYRHGGIIGVEYIF